MEKQKLVQARKQKGITQKKIAELLCMDVSNYNRKKKGNCL
jgi:transcriptional regulator with XRE-family HTH domain